MLSTDTISLAMDKKFTEFSDSVKSALITKMSQHEISTNYMSELDRIQSAKDTFSSVSHASAVPQEPEN